MLSLILNPDSWKKYLISSRAARAGYLEPRLGYLHFDLKNLEKINNISLALQRISGNGKTYIKYGSENITTTVSSKVKESINFPYKQDILEISRPYDSLGQINLIDISLYANDVITNNTNIKLLPSQTSESFLMSGKWKSIFSGFKNYSGIRVIGERLLAKEGAIIEDDNSICQLDTYPPNCFIRDDIKIKFMTSCEITNLQLFKMKVEQNTPFITIREAPTPIIKPIMNNTEEKISNHNFQHNLLNSGIINSISKNKLIKAIRSNGQDFLLIKRMGNFSIPVNELEPNTTYIISINLKKLNGNGKIHLSLDSGQSITVIAETSFQDKIVYIKTGPNPSKLDIFMKEDGIGEVLINKILVKSDFGKILHKQINQTKYNFISNKITNNSSIDYVVKNSCIEYNIYYVENKSVNLAELNIDVEPVTPKAKKWISKIYPFVSGLRIRDLLNVMDNVEKTDKTTILISSLGRLKPSKKIILEEYSTHPSESDLNTLKNCTSIITPSLKNMIELRYLLGYDINIKCLPMCWPKLNLTNECNNYYIYFNKSDQLTDLVLSNWSTDFPLLYVVGSNMYLPKNCKYISEHLSYRDLISYLAGSRGLIHFSENDQYYSAIIDLAFDYNKSICTNNKSYLKQDVVYINEMNDSVRNKFIEFLGKNISLKMNIENNFAANIKELLGEP